MLWVGEKVCGDQTRRETRPTHRQAAYCGLPIAVYKDLLWLIAAYFGLFRLIASVLCARTHATPGRHIHRSRLGAGFSIGSFGDASRVCRGAGRALSQTAGRRVGRVGARRTWSLLRRIMLGECCPATSNKPHQAAARRRRNQSRSRVKAAEFLCGYFDLF